MTRPKLPQAEKSQLRIGYMRLTDSAPLILARETGIYADFGIAVELVREVSWANLRDRLVMGDLDAAQMLSPLPMMTTYGVGGIRANLVTGLVLSLNGNAITLSNRLWQEIVQGDERVVADPLLSATRLKAHVDSGQRESGLTFATVHLYSMHTIQLRMWLRAGGLDPDQDVKIIVLPPEQMCDSLARGIIDGYCVGEPWNTLAVQQGIGSIIATGYRIWNNAPEKVLAVTENWHMQYPSTHLRLRLALMQACSRLGDMAGRTSVAAMLAEKKYLALREATLLPSLSGQLVCSRNSPPLELPDFHVFGRYQAGFPWRSSSELMMQHCGFAMAKAIPKDQLKSLTQRCYRTDLYREAARYLELPSPSQDSRKDGTHPQSWEIEPGIVLGPDLMIGAVS